MHSSGIIQGALKAVTSVLGRKEDAPARDPGAAEASPHADRGLPGTHVRGLSPGL